MSLGWCPCDQMVKGVPDRPGSCAPTFLQQRLLRAWKPAEHQPYYGDSLKSWEGHCRKRVGTAELLGQLWMLGRLSPPGRAGVPMPQHHSISVCQLMDGSWQDPDPVGSHPVAAL